jgi:integrase
MLENAPPTLKKTKRKSKDDKKAGNGQGSVYELANGMWRWQVHLGYTPDGKRQRATGICATPTLAELAKSKAIADYNRGLLGVAESITLSEYTKRWLDAQRDIRASTKRSYRIDLDYALNHLGKMKLKDIRPHHIKDCLTKLSQQMMKGGAGKDKLMCPRTLAMVRSRLKAVFAEAVVDQIIYMNPCQAVKRIKTTEITETVGTILDFHEMTRFHELGLILFEAGMSLLFPALFTAASIGLRRGEVMGLRWQDVDFENDVIQVRQSLSVVTKGKPSLGDLKTRHSRRDIPMPLSLKNVLLLHQEKQVRLKEKARDVWHDSGAVFATALGHYIHPDNLNRALENLLEWSKPAAYTQKSCLGVPVIYRKRLETIVNAGETLPDLRPHDLRHTAASLMLRRGVAVEVVSKILGHSKVSITLDIYRHVLDSEKKQVMVDLFDAPLPVRQVPVNPPN